MSDNTREPGKLYVCPLCGKTSPTKSGWEYTAQGEIFVADRGWDVSCYVNSVQITEQEYLKCMKKLKLK